MSFSERSKSVQLFRQIKIIVSLFHILTMESAHLQPINIHFGIYNGLQSLLASPTSSGPIVFVFLMSETQLKLNFLNF